MDNGGGAYGENWLKVPFSNVEILLSPGVEITSIKSQRESRDGMCRRSYVSQAITSSSFVLCGILRG